VNTKEISSLENDDLLKFYKDDEISYYPNPVKEELYLNWKLTDEKSVTSLQVVDMRGDILNSYDLPKKMNNQNLSFQYYPSGVYIVLVNYSDGVIKKIKIIKQ
jgi:myo-inositol-hexaphosphate 3-phosphohydrolase